MYVIKNAMKNLGRNKGRNILLGCIIFAIISSTSVALIINSTTKEIINDYRNRFGSAVTISPDFEKMMANAKNPDPADSNSNGLNAISNVEAFQIEPIPSKQYLEFANSEYLKSATIKADYATAGVNVKAIDEDLKPGDGGMAGLGGIAIADTPGSQYFVEPKLRIIANTSLDNLEDFSKGIRKIIEGKIYQNKGECVVSAEFAKLNDLKVGSDIEFKDASTKDKSFTLKVSGIYADTSPAYENAMFKVAFMNRRNEILTSYETLAGVSSATDMMSQAEYELKSPDMLADFEKEIRAKGLSDKYLVTTDSGSYNRIVAPVLALSKYSMAFMTVILVLGGIIILIISSIAIRERKYEVGVLRAMGMKKTRVAQMLIAEVLAITILCLGLGLITGSVLAQPVADVMLTSQIEATKDDANNGVDLNGQFGGGTVMIAGDTGSSSGILPSGEQVKPLSEIKINLAPAAIAQISLIAIILAILSSSVGVLYITKYEPIKILSERN